MEVWKTSTLTMVSVCSASQYHLYRLATEDKTNLYRHARHNAHEAIALAKQKAQEFDSQAALERKANEVIKQAKAGPSRSDDTGLSADLEAHSGQADPSSTEKPLVDREHRSHHAMNPEITVVQSILMN